MSDDIINVWFHKQDNCFHFGEHQKFTSEHSFSSNRQLFDDIDVTVIPSNSVFPKSRLSITGDFTV